MRKPDRHGRSDHRGLHPADPVGSGAPGNLWADYDNRAFAYVNKGLFDQAIADENQSLALDPANANGYMNRCNAFLAKANFDAAIADYTRSVALKPNTQSAYNNSGGALAYADRADRL